MNPGKILIVDDEKLNCDIIHSFMMILGLNIKYLEYLNKLAHNGEEAV